MNTRKRIVFLIILVIIVYTTMQFPPLDVVLSNGHYDVLGSVIVPYERLLMGIILYIIGTFFFKWHIKKGNKNDLKQSILIMAFPLILTIIFNIYTSVSLVNLFTELPKGQMFLALALSIVAALIVGFYEELIFRRGIFLLFLSFFESNKKSVLYGAIFSGIFFGIIHLTNLSSESTAYVVYQVVYASTMGFSFCMVYAKTKSLSVCVAMHALIDVGDFFFNISGQPDVMKYQWILIIMSISFLAAGILIYTKIEDSYSLKIGIK